MEILECVRGLLASVFSSFPSSMGKEIRDILKENMMPVLRCLGSCMFTKPVNMQ